MRPTVGTRGSWCRAAAARQKVGDRDVPWFVCRQQRDNDDRGANEGSLFREELQLVVAKPLLHVLHRTAPCRVPVPSRIFCDTELTEAISRMKRAAARPAGRPKDARAEDLLSRFIDCSPPTCDRGPVSIEWNRLSGRFVSVEQPFCARIVGQGDCAAARGLASFDARRVGGEWLSSCQQSWLVSCRSCRCCSYLEDWRCAADG
ncbi:hypothetical protein F5X68DRAFT_206742 [Plectosphaerella plurivora]|uniref:Uncharacterized protein n=1 Tax=Plectosphaerella plurivora TaxID=936078 RepID=A0A9P8VDZ4_9PEZI|nr:hypothetical protein F5X68DRAFT_206742 [Plectosphaerella plurivora]